MQTLWWITLALSLIFGIESGLLMVQKQQKPSISGFITRMSSKKDTLELSDYFLCSIMIFIFSFLALLPIFLGLFSNYTKDIQQSNKTVEIQTKKPIVQYENQTFGSTINPVVLSRTFYAAKKENRSKNVLFGAEVENIAAIFNENELNNETNIEKLDEFEKVWQIPPTGGTRLAFALPENTYNQFRGEYSVTFWLKKGEKPLPSKEVLAEIVIADQNLKDLARKPVKMADFSKKSQINGWIEVTLPYTQKNHGALPHIQLYTSGKDSLWVKKLQITPKKVNMEQNSMPDSFPDVPDVRASEGLARFADPIQHVPGVMAFGPYDATLPAGKYRAVFRLKADLPNKIPQNPLVSLQTAVIYPKTDQQIIENTEIYANNFLEPLTFQQFSVPMQVFSGTRAEFRVIFHDLAPIWLDTITLYPIPEDKEEK